MKRLGRVIGLATQLGMVMGLAAAALVCLGLWAGRRVDAEFGTSPLATMLLSILGAISGQSAVYRLAARTARRSSGNAGVARHASGTSAVARLGLKVCALVTLPGSAGLALGLWIDRMAGTVVLFTATLALVGFLVGLLGCLRLVSAARSSAGNGGDAR
jgi:F0F1-type ATP synthase assembly protein I